MNLNLLVIVLLLQSGSQNPDPQPPGTNLIELPLLQPGTTLAGTIEETDPRIESPILRSTSYADSVVRGKSYRIEVPETGPYTIELRSCFFDSYLVLRGAEGRVIAEDDDGLIRLHARLSLDSMKNGETYFLDACALHGGLGEFELQLAKGRAESLPPLDRVRAEIDDAREAVRLVEARRGEHPDTATSLNNLAAFLHVGDVDYRKRDELASAPAQIDERPMNLLQKSDARGSFLNHWPSLPKSGEESRVITELHEQQFESSDRLCLSGSEATEERVKQELSRHNIIHLVTHGFFQPEGLPSMWRQVKSQSGEMRLEMFEEERRIVGLMPGLLSGLVFAGANRVPDQGRDDGLLTAEEISLLDLSKVELVVLSACETALGKAEAGEGMLGLRRTFRQSGARTVISSLWPVEDRATSLLMQSFYDRLWLRCQGTLEALRGAQLDMLKRNRIENDGNGLPSTWGAFVLDGDWR
jgi:hypothetical protein